MGSTRREFIGKAAAGLTAAALSGLALGARPWPATARKPKLAMQLWTVRKEIERGLDQALRNVKSSGFDFVETAFFPETVTLKQAGKALRGAGLKVISIHCEMPVGNQRQIWSDISQEYECKNMIWHGWPEDARYKTVAGIRQLADSYNEANAYAKSKGLQFGLHNHWWEMTPHTDGRLPFAILADMIDNSIFYEIDTYWTKVAGQLPANVVNQFSGRVKFLHIKDGPAQSPDDTMVAVGTGSQDFPSVAQAAPVNWWVVEFDKCDTDIFTALKKSRDYLVGNGMVDEK